MREGPKAGGREVQTEIEAVRVKSSRTSSLWLRKGEATGDSVDSRSQWQNPIDWLGCVTVNTTGQGQSSLSEDET